MTENTSSNNEPTVSLENVKSTSMRQLNTKVVQRIYSLEAPIEYRIDFVSQLGGGQNLAATYLNDDPSVGWGTEGILKDLGSVVAYERPDGGMALSTWDGPSVAVWAKFNVEPLPPLIYMRKYIVAAVEIDNERPPGFIRVICFKHA